MKLVRIVGLIIMTFTVIESTSQAIEIEQDILSSKNILLGQLGEFEGSIFGLDQLVGKNDLRLDIEGVGGVMYLSDQQRVRVGPGNAAIEGTLHVQDSLEALVIADGRHVLGSRIAISNQSIAGKRWDLLSTGSANSEGAGHLVFDQVGTAARMVIRDNGDVGMGIFADAPAARLDVRATDARTFRAVSNSAIGSWVSIESDNPDGQKWNLISTGNGAGEGPGKLLFHIDGKGVQMTIDTMARVGIGLGNFNPNDALDVFGDIDATGCIQTDDSGSIGGTCLSDRRYKRNIATLDGQLAKVLALNPVSFDWTDPDINGGTTGDIGLIAQEVEEVIPGMVKTGEDGYKRVRYDISLQMRVIKAMQEQQEIISAQQDQIATQQSEIDLLQKEMEELRALVGKK